MRKTLLILLTAVILFSGYRLVVAPPQVKEGSIPYDTIICFGDSLTYGTGAVPGMDYPSQLSKMIGRPVINAGVPGNTTARALKRLEQDVLSRSPDLVLITLGGNDLKNGIAKDVAFKNLKMIIFTITKPF
jgi:lysophospholipase L1-like esterase